MLDTRARTLLEAPLERLSGLLDRPHVTPDRLTLLGLVLGVGSAVAAGRSLWWLALALWLVSRLLDGLDGALARRRRRANGGQDGGAGGFLDITADFLVYGSFVVGVALGSGGSLTPFLLVLLAYYVNGAAFLAFSSIAERRGVPIADGRSLSFIGGLAEGTETVFVHSLWCVIPEYAAQIAWVWAGVVALSAFQRIVTGYSTLRRPRSSTARPTGSGSSPVPEHRASQTRTDMTWSSPVQATVLICRGTTFPTASRIALVVGSLLTVINQGTVIINGEAGATTWIRIGANYLIPYVVSSIGYLSSFRVRPVDSGTER